MKTENMVSVNVTHNKTFQVNNTSEFEERQFCEISFSFPRARENAKYGSYRCYAPQISASAK